ncbi:MAG: glycogen synthase [Bacilli bacterium]|nr:glycogen synthase [Bacilli bacterium]
MRIAMVASEANPLCKTGGLADVIWSLSHELVQMGHDAFIVIPFYKTIKDKNIAKVTRVGKYEVRLSWRRQLAEIFKTEINGVTFYLIGNDFYFDRDNLYGYGDDSERFAFYTLAVRQFFPFLNEKVDVIHIHDWQVGMLPVLIREQSLYEPVYDEVKFVMTLHNEAFKGYFDRYFLNHFYGLGDYLYDDGRVRFDNMVSSLKSGIIFSDKIVAVSPNHAKELLTPGDDMRLDGVLSMRSADFTGIVNGVDEEEFDPEHDPLIAKNFSASKHAAGKKACRQKLIQSFELNDDDAPIFGLVSRLTFQKGIDLILAHAETLLNSGAKLVILGSGEKGLEEGFQSLHDRYPGQCGVYIGYSNQIAHDVYAGSDFFLMPSLFEPCGIGQMIAQRYGTLPIARAVGGLKDTIVAYDGENEKVADGFLFENYDVNGLAYACDLALGVYADKKKMNKLLVNAMKANHSWRKSAELYLGIYREITGKAE